MIGHTFVNPADPYLTCLGCGKWVTFWHDPEECDCSHDAWFSLPCGHDAGVHSLCPSWGPVDGCRCIEHLGVKDHPEPSDTPVDVAEQQLRSVWTVNAITKTVAEPDWFCRQMAEALDLAGLLITSGGDPE